MLTAMDSFVHNQPGYSALMEKSRVYLELNLNLRDPVEIGDFVAAFAALGSQFDKYIEEHHPAAKGRARVYVKEVRKGSIEADLIAGGIELMDAMLVVGGFAALFNKRVRDFINGKPEAGTSKSVAKDIGEFVRAVARDSDGVARIQKVTMKGDEKSYEHVLEFDTKDAKSSLETAARLVAEELAEVPADPEEEYPTGRQLMRFWQHNKGDQLAGKKSTGQKVVVGPDSRPRVLRYASPMVEQEMASELEGRDYKRWIFDVTVTPLVVGASLKAYRLDQIHGSFEDDDPATGSLFE